jgi:hypothetical protein
MHSSSGIENYAWTTSPLTMSSSALRCPQPARTQRTIVFLRICNRSSGGSLTHRRATTKQSKNGHCASWCRCIRSPVSRRLDRKSISNRVCFSVWCSTPGAKTPKYRVRFLCGGGISIARLKNSYLRASLLSRLQRSLDDSRFAPGLLLCENRPPAALRNPPSYSNLVTRHLALVSQSKCNSCSR